MVPVGLYERKALQVESNQQIRLFYSYAHTDITLRNELDKHLSALRRGGFITQYSDCDISAGMEWAKQINSHLNSAHIILLLISSDFLASDYCYSVEMNRALERHQAGEARVIPILLRYVDWHHTPFAELQVLPQDSRPVTSWADQDLAFRNIALKLREVVEELRASLMMNAPLYQKKSDLNDALHDTQINTEENAISKHTPQEYIHISPPTLQAFTQFRHYQRQVDELKSIHNMLHEIEVALEGLAATIQLVIRSEIAEHKKLSRKAPISLNEQINHHLPNFNYIEIIWRQIVLKIDHLAYFAATEMKALGDERLSFSDDVVKGALWVKDLFILQRSFEASVSDRNIDAVEKLSGDLLTKCRSHLYQIDKRLLSAVKELDSASNLLVRYRT